jgi:23S rRNA pseudouridine1911/1915/1917 synthase
LINRIPDLDKRIIFENDDLLIIDKPFDIPTTGKTLTDDDSVQFWVNQREGRMVWAVHQLDADTTGVNIFVKHKKLVKIYKEYLSLADSSKYYLAIVHGNPVWNEIEEKSNIGYIDKRSLGVSDQGKSAHSHFCVIDRSENFSLIQARIFTGRTHQIRIHLSHLGHPLVGEEWYCKPPCKLHIRQALHAWKVFLNSDPKQSFIASPPVDFMNLADKLGLHIIEN